LLRDQTAAIAKALKANDPAAAASTSSTDSLAQSVQGELGRDAFLQLLVLQMQNQDPLDPMDNQDMIAQLAQFSSLEQMENLNSQFEFLSGNIDQLNFIAANELVGKTVAGLDLDGNLHKGVVQSVHLDGSVVILNVDGVLMSMAGIADISETPDPGGDTANGGSILKGGGT
jgi:flagellar basal-body rod modification protein FlgD